MLEHFFQCPYCWAEISMLLVPSVSEQDYVEDCEICCNPIAVSVEFQANELASFHASKLGQ